MGLTVPITIFSSQPLEKGQIILEEKKNNSGHMINMNEESFGDSSTI